MSASTILIDSHCHCDRLDLNPYQGHLSSLLEASHQKGVRYLLNACVRLDEFDALLSMTEQYRSTLCCSVGMHPSEAVSVEPTVDYLIEQANRSSLVVAIGETGLDYQEDQVVSREVQKERLRVHIRAARLSHKPLIIHHRMAKPDLLQVLREEKGDEVGGVMHCFTEDWDFAKQALDLGFYISFSGIVTFKSASLLRETAKKVSLDRLLIETDAPFLAPVPYRGKSNEPKYLYDIALFLSNILNVSLDALAEITTKNFYQLFGDPFCSSR